MYKRVLLEFPVDPFAQRLDERFLAGVRRAVDEDFWPRALGGTHFTDAAVFGSAAEIDSKGFARGSKQQSWAHRCFHDSSTRVGPAYAAVCQKKAWEHKKSSG